MLQNVILLSIIILLMAVAVGYLYKAKKKGQKCIGCPYAASCSGGCQGKKKAS